MRSIDERLEYVRARGAKNDTPALRFTTNLASAVGLIHEELKHLREAPALLDQAARNYVIALVTNLETYYRDVLASVAVASPEHKLRLLEHLPRKFTLAEFEEHVRAGLGSEDVLVTELNFQKLEALVSVMSLVLGKNYLNELDGGAICYSVQGQATRDILPKGWRATFESLFEHRHRFVHNAHTKLGISLEKVGEMEHVAVVVPQMTDVLLNMQFAQTVPNRWYGYLSQRHPQFGDLPAILLVPSIIGPWTRLADAVEGQADADGSFRIVSNRVEEQSK